MIICVPSPLLMCCPFLTTCRKSYGHCIFQKNKRQKMLYVSVCLGCYNKIPETEYLSTTEILSHSSGGWTSEIMVPALLVLKRAVFLACRWLPSHYVLIWLFCDAGRERWSSLVSLRIRTLIQSNQLPPSPKPVRPWPPLTLTTSIQVLSPNSATVGVKVSIYEFWEDLNI